MTKTAMKIAKRYSNYFKAWLITYCENPDCERQDKLLELLEDILAIDCNLGYIGVAKLREKALDEFYETFVK